MKKLIILLIATTFSLQLSAQKTGDTIVSNNAEKLKLKVYYFHITNRCNTCTHIELNLRKTIETHFQKELNEGIVDLYILNCENHEYKDLVKKYDAYGSTLAITSFKNGVEQKTEDLSNFAFSKAHNEEIFISELKMKIDENIK
jgi:hypothetical protein